MKKQSQETTEPHVNSVTSHLNSVPSELNSNLSDVNSNLSEPNSVPSELNYNLSYVNSNLSDVNSDDLNSVKNLREIEEYNLKDENTRRNGESENFKSAKTSFHTLNTVNNALNSVNNTPNTANTTPNTLNNTVNNVNNTVNNTVNNVNNVGVNRFVVGNDFLRPAGLSSDRCMRDFASAKNRKFYSKMNYSNQSLTTESPTNSTLSNSTNSRTSVLTKVSTACNKLEGENEENSVKKSVERIFRSNSILRNENRMRNTTHEDIFGAKDYNKRTRHHSHINSRDLSSTHLNSRDLNSRDLNSRDINSRDLSSDYAELPTKRNSNSLNTLNSVNSVNSVNSINTVKSVDRVDRVENVLMSLWGLRSETSESELENLCRCSKVQIVSISLDRNIITHYCTGTGKINLKSPKLDNLTHFKKLLKLNGYNFKT
ncbi:hypothetical protein TpMuguga_03g00019 [Theileria parva strain Muguga]|uniref:Uncharacterized protein n=1 Tax=Theileria parva TaxID=5875 RepID=Q4N0T8_THEPA|nr:uncharacterized protein TpMuguga_03g00019 [Theileria parva strain Muguga]EAN30755.1 hypothetical protein TpMuguga_03g00019 [Theileria parva strain Muguga]|eukprot:XP_763038.1 hypothetical protein [Theileria parva strain Muguga]